MLRPRTVWTVSIVATALVIASACSSGIGGSATGTRQPRAVPQAYSDVGLGFDPNLSLAAPIAYHAAVAGASIPSVGGGGDRLVTFFAFVTAAPADDADGMGNALDRATTPPADTNGAEDVFLAAVDNTEVLVNNEPQPAAFTQALANVFRDVRCTRCHSFHYPGGFRVAGHRTPQPAGSNEGCGECHTPANTLAPGGTLANVVWIAPDPDQTAAPVQDFRGLTDRQLFDLVMALPDPRTHLQTDDKIIWAIESGRVPFNRVGGGGGAIPMDLQQWLDQVQAWTINSPPQFSTDGAVDDIVLVSQADAGNTAGDGASMWPTATFEPNAAFTPVNPTAAPAGWVHVAFASDATDLIAGVTSPNRDIFRTRIRVDIDANQNIDLVFEGAGSRLVSESTTANTGGNGDSDRPAMSQDGDSIAFESNASDLVTGFVEGNAPTEPDVFLRAVQSGTTTLQSHSTASVVQGGDAGSHAPSITPGGAVVAFESDATDLANADTNAVRDVFYAREVLGTLIVTRASVRSGGAEASGGASSQASVWRDTGTDEVFVAFESAKTGLDTTVAGTPASSVYLHRSTGPVTTMISRVGSVAGDGASSHPVISPDGSRIVYQSLASNLDAQRTDDLNGENDIYSFDFAAFRASSAVASSRLSLAASGANANGPSTTPNVTGFINFSNQLQTDVLLSFETTATNLGRSPNSNHVFQFLIDRANPRTVAQFNADPKSGRIPVTIQFTDLSSNAQTWMWDFGDGSSSTLQNPSHTYTTVGTFDVSLTVTGPGGTDTATKTNLIMGNPSAPTWTEVYTTYFSSCDSCHNDPINTRTFDMRTQGVAYANMVGIATVTPGCLSTRVVAGNASASALVNVLGGSPCTAFTMGSVGPQGIQDVSDWIDDGAPNN